MSQQDEGDNSVGEAVVVPSSQKGSFMQFMKTIATTTSDLHTLSCPAFLLDTRSILELFTSYVRTPQAFCNIALQKDPAERMLAVVAFWMHNQWHSYGSPFAGGKAIKKPFNPVLGEQFFCKFEDAELGTTELLAEQVSHHPPMSATYIKNDKLNIHLNASLVSRTRFRGTGIKVENFGHTTIRLPVFNDEYRLTFPESYLRGIVTGRVFIELIGTTEITSRSGYGAKIQFLAKPWFSGEYHAIKGEIFKVSPSGKRTKDDLVYTLSGKWAGGLEAVHIPTGTHKVVVADVVASPTQDPIVRPLAEQNELESQRVWGATAEALRVEDYGTAMREKTAVEEYQRKLRKEREAAGEVWQPKFFRNVTDPAHLIDEVDRRKDGKEGTCYWEYINFPKVDA